jgi:Fe-S-cluster containining protein
MGANRERTARVTLAFRVHGRPVMIDARIPDRPVRLDELLPALRELDDRVIGATVARTEAGGAHVSCAKGCSACCRAQPVPVTPPEASALARLVERLPEPRRTAVRAAFAANVERLREAGLYETYMQRDPEMTRDQARDVARRYMALKLACPFLSDDACSIYAERPFVCRQYLVTSPPPLCDAPLDSAVKHIPMPGAFATAMLEAGEALTGRAQYTVPLALALDCAEAHRADIEKPGPAQQTFEQIVRKALT